MSIGKKEITASVLGPFQARGWKKKGQSAYYEGREVCAVINVQGSPFGADHYINVGFWFSAPAGAFVRENDCPVNRRLERMLPEAHELILAATNTRHTSVGRLAALRALLETNAVSLIEGLCSIAALKEAIERGTIGAGLVTVEAKAVLGLG